MGTGGPAILPPAPSRLCPEVAGEDQVEQALGAKGPSKDTRTPHGCQPVRAALKSTELSADRHAGLGPTSHPQEQSPRGGAARTPPFSGGRRHREAASGTRPWTTRLCFKWA